MSEAQIISKIVEYLQQALLLNVYTQVCIITFYSAQVTEIQNILASHGLMKSGIVRVMTVDSFQGWY